MTVKISIIVPIYNVQDYVEKCIESILAQSFREFELLIINDGSQDNSLQICRKYLSDQRVHIISQENRGLSAARNAGICKARGKYIFFVDGDDYISPDLLENLYHEMILENADIVQCGFIWTMEDGRKVEEKYNGLNVKKVLYGDEWFEYYERYSLLFTVAWNKLYHKTVFNKIKYPEGKVFEDEYVNFPLYFKSKKIVILNKGLYYYVQRGSGICGKTGVDKRIEAFLEYAPRRMQMLWHYNKLYFYRYLYLYYKELISFENLAKEQKISEKMILNMKRQSAHFLGYLWIHTDIPVSEKVKILKWNLKGIGQLWMRELLSVLK